VAIEWATIIEGGIPILMGLYATAVGHGAFSRPQIESSQNLLKFRRQFRWLGPLVVLFGCFIAWHDHVQATHPSAELIARQIRARMKFPVRLDDVTQLNAVEGRGDRLVYEAALHLRMADWGGKERAQQKLRDQVLKTACASKDFQTIFRGGYTLDVHYTFLDSADGVLLSIAPGTCGYEH
jgi:hypothetical protein